MNASESAGAASAIHPAGRSSSSRPRARHPQAHASASAGRMPSAERWSVNPTAATSSSGTMTPPERAARTPKVPTAAITSVISAKALL